MYKDHCITFQPKGFRFKLTQPRSSSYNGIDHGITYEVYGNKLLRPVD